MIRGLVINRFNNRGIFLETIGSSTIAGNYIGTNAAGTASFSAPNNGLGIYVTTPNNTIGGLTPADEGGTSLMPKETAGWKAIDLSDLPDDPDNPMQGPTVRFVKQLQKTFPGLPANIFPRAGKTG
jgi:hypothetical protein